MPPLINSKSRLAVELSKLKVFDNPDLYSEQYPMDSEIGAEMLWGAYFKGDIEGKTVADLGCGTGILGIGALLLGAKLVYFIDIDEKSLQTAKENLKTIRQMEGQAVFINKDINGFSEKVNTVVQNPPFGTKKKHADRDFLLKAFEIAKVIYSFHKTTSERFIQEISKDNGFSITNYYKFNFPIKASHLFHKRKLHRIGVGCWRMESVQQKL